MAAEDVVVMRWPLHSGELLQNLCAMRDRGEMNDVTLITPDGSVEAHRVILAASSELLRDMLKRSPAFVPCSLVLRDITEAQLNLVLDFVYKGELAVLKTQLNDLARACDYLQIKTCLSSLESADGACQEFEEGQNGEDDRDEENDDEPDGGGGVDDEAEHVDEECNAEEPETDFIEPAPNKGLTNKMTRRTKVTNTSEATTESDKIPISADEVEMEDLQSSAATYEVITFEDVKEESADDAKPKSRQSYAKKARLSIVGDKRVYTLDDDKLVGDAPSQIGPDRRFCRECRITLSYPKEFREHRKQWHALQCARCDFRATKESTIREHFEKVHENIRRFSCDVCPFQCKDRATLLNHSRRHTNEKPYECGYCDYKSAQSASMKQHVTLHENVESRPFPCDECTRHPISFGSRAALTKHKKAHHTARVMAFTIIQEDQALTEATGENS
ncbi:transcriptional repressor CTCFL [Galendromus occidentalis]|uniref:Transcriptional repressor CTCFL n=1 Tax=Galendromus occidentalis TaxID=34638 RepID=A0AAJ6QMU9_9ACAR|nr:transcriptional repressor CTCFL [Galendromus occidentalis]